jgi:Flp pilus assembly pilin Flp
MHHRSVLRRLRLEDRGAAALEFALITPVLMMFMMGIGDLLHALYTRSIVVGAVQKAGRDGTIQNRDSATATTALDEKVMTIVRQAAPGATFVSTRQNYANFSNVDKPEPHTDKAGGRTGQYDRGECYSDTNGNGSWDSDGGRTGVGGANDIAQYTITVTYPRLFPLPGLDWGANGTITASTVLKNQPYAAQGAATAETICR